MPGIKGSPCQAFGCNKEQVPDNWSLDLFSLQSPVWFQFHVQGHLVRILWSACFLHQILLCLSSATFQVLESLIRRLRKRFQRDPRGGMAQYELELKDTHSYCNYDPHTRELARRVIVLVVSQLATFHSSTRGDTVYKWSLMVLQLFGAGGKGIPLIKGHTRRGPLDLSGQCISKLRFSKVANTEIWNVVRWPLAMLSSLDWLPPWRLWSC